MPLSWNEIKTRSLAFSKEWQEESAEDAEAKSFWDSFFNRKNQNAGREATETSGGTVVKFFLDNCSRRITRFLISRSFHSFCKYWIPGRVSLARNDKGSVPGFRVNIILDSLMYGE